MSIDALNIPLTDHQNASSQELAFSLSESTPRLRKNVEIRTQESRGENWWIVENKETGASYRLDSDTYAIVARLDGSKSLDQLFSDLAIDDELERQHIRSLLEQLQRAELLVLHNELIPSDLRPKQDRYISGHWIGKLKNPLAIRVPLWDPDAFLTRSTPLLSRCLNGYFISALMLIVVLGVTIAGQQFASLTSYGTARAGELSSFLLLALVYPFIKGIHELAHAYSIKRHGGEVHEMGVMLLVFFPVPYVDASASSIFSLKRQRIEVAAAGIAAELVLAALAILVWANIQHGLLSDVAFSVALIGGLSTLLFNGNPLLRFDGYFVFSDYLEIPNLAPRARSYCLYLIRRFVLGVTGAISPVTARGEPGWFVSYFVASSAYRLIIMFGIAVYLIQLLPLFGLLLAMLAVTNQLLLPTIKSINYLVSAEELSCHRTRSISSASALISIIIIIVAFMPVSNWVTLPGVVSLPDSGIVRASESGFIDEVVIDNGSRVATGQTIAILSNEILDKEADRLNWRIKELEARRAAVILSAPSEAAQFVESINAVQRELNDVNRRIQANSIVAPTSGYLQYVKNAEWQGRYVAEGESLAHIINNDERKITSVVPEAYIAEIRHRDTRTSIRTQAATRTTLQARIATITPAGSRTLSDAAFGSKYGGAIAVDSRDESGKLALEQTFQIELTPLESKNLLPGSTVHIRYDLPRASIATQWYGVISRLLMKEINW